MTIETEQALRAEIYRLTQLVEAANQREPGVLRVQMMDDGFPPTLVVTAPGMDEVKLASYMYDLYALLFANYRAVCKENSQSIKSARRIYNDAADVAEKYGHGPCAAELRRRADHVGAVIRNMVPELGSNEDIA